MESNHEQAKHRESLKPNILDVWGPFKFYGYRLIAAYSQQTDGTKVSEYMTLNLMRELGIKSRMQKRYRKPKTVVTFDQKTNLFTPEQVKALINRIIELTCDLFKGPSL